MKVKADEINAIKYVREKNIPFSDYGTTFAKEWYQIFFHDPVGNVIEVHQILG